MLTHEEFELMIGEAVRNGRAAADIVKAVGGMETGAQLSALLTAVTAIIERTIPARDRLSVLNEHLRETITDWAQAAAVAPAAVGVAR